jgi:hypothetical protein
MWLSGTQTGARAITARRVPGGQVPRAPSEDAIRLRDHGVNAAFAPHEERDTDDQQYLFVRA